MIIARVGRVSPEPEDKTELGRKLAIVAGLSDPGLSEIGAFTVRKAAIEKPKTHVHHVLRSSNNYFDEDEKRIIGRKLALVAGVL